MNFKYKVSVIIPVSRSSESLYKCLNSLAKQVMTDFELILVGETDNIKIPENLNVITINEKNTSPSIRRNIAVKVSKGKILCFLDDDTEVSEDYLMKIVKRIDKDEKMIIGGPNYDKRKEYRYRFSSAIQSCFLTEGLLSHKEMKSTKKEVGIHDLPLCNIAMSREIYNRIGGFNEKISYYLDDVEFHYIAKKLGYKLVSYQDLEIQHDIRPSFLPYFKYKWNSRYEIGKVFPIYYELYLDSFQIKAVLLSYILFTLFIFLIFLYPTLIFIPSFLIILYITLLLISALLYYKDVTVSILLPFGIFITHLAMYFGFTIGLIKGILNYSELKKLLSQKYERYKIGT